MCTCIINVHNRLENVKESRSVLQLRKTQENANKLQACEKIHKDGQSPGKLTCVAQLIREQLRKRMMHVRNISDIHIHKTGY